MCEIKVNCIYDTRKENTSIVDIDIYELRQKLIDEYGSFNDEDELTESIREFLEYEKFEDVIAYEDISSNVEIDLIKIDREDLKELLEKLSDLIEN